MASYYSYNDDDDGEVGQQANIRFNRCLFIDLNDAKNCYFRYNEAISCQIVVLLGRYGYSCMYASKHE